MTETRVVVVVVVSVVAPGVVVTETRVVVAVVVSVADVVVVPTVAAALASLPTGATLPALRARGRPLIKGFEDFRRFFNFSIKRLFSK